MEFASSNNLPPKPSLGEILRQGIQTLIAGGIDNARLDAEVLLATALATTRDKLIVGTQLPVSSEQVTCFESLLLRRLRREPIAYITGRQEFWSLEFRVTHDVLIPRPETERLIEVTLSLVTKWPIDRPLRLVDLGTGSGMIAVCLANEVPSAQIWATDVSGKALAVARANARFHGVGDRISFKAGNMFAALAAETGLFDFIISNPPYVRRDEIATLEPEISRWEPRRALDGGADGLDFYRCIAAQAWKFVSPQGAVVMEIGAPMGSEVLAIFNEAGFYRDVTTVQDYAGRDRVMIAVTAAHQLGSN
jgi:release factor glutamine methyltransferase